MYVIGYTVNGVHKTIRCGKAELEDNMQIARSEADYGACTLNDNGEPEPVKPVTSEELLDILLGGDENE